MSELLDEVIDSINQKENFCIEYIEGAFCIILKREGFNDLESRSIVEKNKKIISNCFRAIKDIFYLEDSEDFDIPDFD